jgi:hypothetical protein
MMQLIDGLLMEKLANPGSSAAAAAAVHASNSCTCGNAGTSDNRPANCLQASHQSMIMVAGAEWFWQQQCEQLGWLR